MKKFVVYTVIVGGYDDVKQPSVIDERFDYVLFTDIPEVNSIGAWQIRRIPYESERGFLISRYPKIHPELVLPEYDAWLYHDGKLQLIEQKVYDRCIEQYEEEVEWAGCNHSLRRSLYEEMSAIILNRTKGVHDYDCIDWYYYLKENGYPDENHLKDGYLLEAGVVFRRNTPNVKKVNDIWWWAVENYVSRDQFALMYAIWRVKDLKVSFLIPKDENVLFGGKYFLYSEHRTISVVSPGFLEHIRRRAWRECHKEGELYTQVFEESYRISSRHPHLALNLWTFIALFRYGVVRVFGKSDKTQ